MRSLQLRIIVAIVVVCAATLLVVGSYVGRATILVHLSGPAPSTLSEVRTALAATLRTTHSRAPIQLALVRLGARYGLRIFLVDSTSGFLTSVWEPSDTDRLITHPDGTFELSSGGLASAERYHIALRGGAPMDDDRGRPRWHLFVFGADSTVDALEPVRGLILRSIWQSAAVGLAAAVTIAILLGSYIVRPIRELTAAATAMSQGDTTRRVSVRTDDEIGRLSASFNMMAVSIETTERLRRQMITDVAHELRSPLTRMVAQLEAAQDGHLCESDALAGARENTARLVLIVNDLRDLSLADARELPFAKDELSLNLCIDEAIERMKRSAVQSNVTLVREIPSDLPKALGDEHRVAQILDNLVANALHYTQPGGDVVIGARASATHLECFVQDDGEGIAPKHLPLIFERFYRADSSRSRATGGSGLGLAIVKSFVEAQGGTITVDSVLGRGSRFTWTLPRA